MCSSSSRQLAGVAAFLCCFVLLGGAFLRAQAPGTVDPVFGGASLGLSGNVLSVVMQPDGKVLVGGTFARGLVRLDTDGSLDANFDPDINGGARLIEVSLIVLQPDGKILVGGGFSQINGVSRNNFARLNADGSLDTGFNVDLVFDMDDAGYVGALAVQSDGKIVIAGSFAQVNGVSETNLARLNANGSLDTSFQAGITDGGIALVLQPDGKIVIGGYFGQPNNVTRLNADGSLDTSFSAGADAEVSVLALQPDGKIVIGGGFTHVNSVSHNHLARLNADGSLDSGFNADSDNDLEALVLQSDGKIVVGDYSADETNGVSYSGIARLNADGSLDTSFYAAPDSTVKTLALQSDGEIVVGGDFGQINGVDTNSVVRLTSDGQIDHSFNADEASGPNSAVSKLALQLDGKIIIGGVFTQVHGAGHKGVARLNADGSVDTGFNANILGEGVNLLALQPDGKTVVGGGFSQIDGDSQPGLARLDADGSLDTGFHVDTDYLVQALALQPDGKIVLGGEYGVLARLNADGGLDTSFQAGIDIVFNDDETISALAVQPDGKIVLGGFFGSVNGLTRYDLARLNADGSLDTGFRADIGSDYSEENHNSVSALALQPDGKILVGGYFTQVAGVSRNNLARLNADGSLDTGFTAETESNSGVGVLVLQPDGKIVIGGNFTQVNGVSQNNVARLNADGSLDPFFNPGGSGPDQPVYTLALQSDGKIFVGGSFTSVNGVLRNYVARLNGGGAPDMFGAGVPVGGGFYYEQFPDGLPFGYYNLSGNDYTFPYFFHVDLGLEYFFDANDGKGGAYLFDFASSGFFYTSPTFPWPYLYDFSLNTVLYYYPDPGNPGRYNTDGYRFFYRFDTGQIIIK